MGNGARAQQKRDRNAKDAQKGPTSQLKSNQQALSIMCETCRSTFLSTVREPALKQHAESKHNKTMKDCFPNWTPPPPK